MVPNRISQFATKLSELENTPDAKRRLIERYAPAARSYFLAATRSDEAADDLLSELTIRVMEGRLSNFSHTAGGPYFRFRDYFKRQLSFLIKEWRRSKAKAHQSSGEVAELADFDDALLEAQFDDDFRRLIIQQVLAAMESDGTGQRYAALLRLRFASPESTYEQLSERWTFDEASGIALRNIWPRAKDMINALVRLEIAEQIGSDDPAMIDEELSAIALWSSTVKELLQSPIA